MDLYDNSIGAGHNRRQSQRLHKAAYPDAMGGVDDYRKVAFLLQHRNGIKVKHIAVGRLMGADTPLGPFILAGGLSRGNGALYLILGRVF